MDSSLDFKPKHTGEAPSRRPPEDEPERVGEGELDEGPPRSLPIRPNDECDAEEDLLESDA